MKHKLIITMLVAGAVAFAGLQPASANCGACGGGKKKGSHHDKTEKAKHGAIHMKMHKHHSSAADEVTISVPVLKRMLEADAVPVLLDARGGKYDDGRRIPGAKTMTPDTSKKKIAEMIPEKDTLVVVYCANPQCPASTQLASRLHKLGYKNILELPEGIDGWAEAGHEVEQVK